MASLEQTEEMKTDQRQIKLIKRPPVQSGGFSSTSFIINWPMGLAYFVLCERTLLRRNSFLLGIYMIFFKPMTKEDDPRILGKEYIRACSYMQGRKNVSESSRGKQAKGPGERILFQIVNH